MVEQLTLNQLVEGSSPSRSTSLFYKLLEAIRPQSGNESGNETESVPYVADSHQSVFPYLKKNFRGTDESSFFVLLLDTPRPAMLDCPMRR